MKKTSFEHWIASLRKTSWKSVWAGDWTLLPCSDWGEFYTRDLKILGKGFVSQVIYIFRDGKVTCWLNEEDIDKVVKRLAVHVGLNVDKVRTMTTSLKSRTDAALRFMKMNDHADLTLKVFEEYLQTIRDYYRFHIPVKYVVDGMSTPQLQKFLSAFQKARVYAEPVFDQTLIFDRNMAKSLSRKLGLKAEQVLFMTKGELRQYFIRGKVPANQELVKRRKRSVLAFKKVTMRLYIGNDAQLVEAALISRPQEGFLKGMPAYPGIVKGVARVIFDPSKIKRFDKGDILVAPMTRPEYLPLMKKASAFVTDTGGMLAHAAIIAREMKKPCVIGTKIATRVFKDGDMVEVDATKGVVRKI